MSISDMFTNEVSIYRPTTTVDSGGSPIDTLTETGTILCRIQRNKGFEPIEGGRKFSKPSYILYCDTTEDILMDDQVLFDSAFYNVIESEVEANDNTYRRIVMTKAEE